MRRATVTAEHWGETVAPQAIVGEVVAAVAWSQVEERRQPEREYLRTLYEQVRGAEYLHQIGELPFAQVQRWRNVRFAELLRLGL